MSPGPLRVAPEAPLPTPRTLIHLLDIYPLPSPRPRLPPPRQLSHAPHSHQPLPAHQPPLITCTLGSEPLYLHQGLHSPATNSMQDLRQTQSLWTSVSPCGTSGLQETWREWLFLPKPSLEGASCPQSSREGPGDEQKGQPLPTSAPATLHPGSDSQGWGVGSRHVCPQGLRTQQREHHSLATQLFRTEVQLPTKVCLVKAMVFPVFPQSRMDVRAGQ